MTVKECYEKMGEDYTDVLGRLGNEKIIARFAKKFPQDKSYGEIITSVQTRNVEDAFRAAHTLKGVSLNLGFLRMYEISAALTEIFRGGSFEGTEEWMQRLEERYDNIVECIDCLDCSS
jgi:histidine phosphotransfer protein HptB